MFCIYKNKNFTPVLMVFVLVLFFIILFNILVISEKEAFKNIKPHYTKLPRFWVNTGFCPLGDDISTYLLRDDVRQHLNLIGSLPNNGIESIRIHWLLDLIEVNIPFEESTVVFNFTKLDILSDWVNEAGLALGLEFMGNPNNLFTNKSQTSLTYFWQTLTYELILRYLGRYGEAKLIKWKFETWNEPDLKNYNRINFTSNSFIEYAIAVSNGMKKANKNLKLRGPAGLFKQKEKHPICWNALKFCNDNLGECPFEVLTFHRKGKNGKNSTEVAEGGKNLIQDIFNEFPNLKSYPISNDEADPISGWSTARSFQSDIVYAIELVKIVLDHWTMKLNTKEFENLDSISHDNAFMSYHPYEFDQRTLFARFQMNNSVIPYSQFIAKPVFIALGMLAHLGDYAEDVIINDNIQYLTTMSIGLNKTNLYMAIIAVPVSIENHPKSQFSFTIKLPKYKSQKPKFAVCVEILERNETNPIELWYSYGKPAYPTSDQREWMRRIQGPRVLENRIIPVDEEILKIKYNIKSPWVALIRICNIEYTRLKAPENIRFLKVTKGEVLIFWEYHEHSNCVKTFILEYNHLNNTFEYEINNSNDDENETDYDDGDDDDVDNIERDRSWRPISRGWRVPFRYFQYKSKRNVVTGYYRIRAMHISGKVGPFSSVQFYQEK